MRVLQLRQSKNLCLVRYIVGGLVFLFQKSGHFRNYKSISGIPIHKTEIRTTKSTKSVHVCITVVSFSPTAAYLLKFKIK